MQRTLAIVTVVASGLLTSITPARTEVVTTSAFVCQLQLKRVSDWSRCPSRDHTAIARKGHVHGATCSLTAGLPGAQEIEMSIEAFSNASTTPFLPLLIEETCIANC